MIKPCIFLPVALVILFSCSPPSNTKWKCEIAFQTEGKVGGCAIGDADPTRPGNEIVAVCISGESHVIYNENGTWKNEMVVKTPGEMIQCAVGECDPDRPGHEIVAVGIDTGDEDSGGPGAAWIMYRNGEKGWTGEKIHEEPALIHGVCIGDEGIFVTGYANTVTLLKKESIGWKPAKVADLPAEGKNAVYTDKGIYVACADGSLVLLSGAGSKWSSTVVDKRESGRARLGYGGGGLIVCDNDGTLSLVGDEGCREIYSEENKLRGAVLADLDPNTPGEEAATAGYGRTITILYRQGKGWKAETVYSGKDRFHHLAAGDLDGEAGPDLAGCNFAGRVVVVKRGN